MACNSIQLSGYVKGCDTSVGGINTVVLVEASSIEEYTIDASGQVTELTLNTGATAYKYEFLKDSASNYTDAIVGGAGVSVSWTPTVNMVFRKNSLAIINEIYELAKGYLVAIVRDNNGESFVLGLNRYLEMAGSAGSVSGNVLTEGNTVTIMLTGAEARPMLPVDLSAGSQIDPKILNHFGF